MGVNGYTGVNWSTTTATQVSLMLDVINVRQALIILSEVT